MSTRDEAYKDWKAGMPYKDIAKKHGVTESAVKSWASRYWKDEKTIVATKKRLQNKVATSKSKVATEKLVTEITNEAMLKEVDKNEKLTEQQKEFCFRYIQNRNATQAYLKAYKCSYEVANARGCLLLTKDEIKKELQRLKEIKNATLGLLCADDIVEMHMRIAFADITDFVDFETEDVEVEGIDKKVKINRLLVKNSNQVDGTLITEITTDKNNIKVKLADKQRSLKFLEDYFELNPQSRHKRDFDKAKIEIERERLELIKENGNTEIENTDETDADVYG